MEREHPEYSIASKLGEETRDHLVRQVIRSLQKMDYALLSGEDTPLRNTWDEICVQAQGEESVNWNLYLMVIKSTVEGVVEDLADYQKEALWLLTDEGEDWDCQREDERELFFAHVPDITRYLEEHVLRAACDWSNERIRRWMERGYIA